ncbi:MAG TPA: helix-turn-helix transcriptional regulator [Geobacteraceae bacterium]
MAIDGARVRAVREAKKLTQLYVANVVGVTTDTISRWENNRYPSIKRENAEKLAAALEVELTEILKQEEAVPPAEEVPRPQKRKWWYLAILVLVLLAGGGAILLFLRGADSQPVAVRKLPHFAAPGQIIPVQIKVNRTKANREGFIIRERLPIGWRFVASIPPPAAWQVSAEEVKWLVPGGTAPLTISYTVLVGPQAAMNSEAEFTGAMVAHARGATSREAIGDDRLIKVAGIHWADANGDGRIDDDEIMPAYYLTEEMKGLGLDWKTIEAIWSAKGYAWEQQKKEFRVLK